LWWQNLEPLKRGDSVNVPTGATVAAGADETAGAGVVSGAAVAIGALVAPGAGVTPGTGAACGTFQEMEQPNTTQKSKEFGNEMHRTQ